MDYVQVVIDSFWQIMAASTPLIVPIISVLLLFSILRGLFFNDR